MFNWLIDWLMDWLTASRRSAVSTALKCCLVFRTRRQRLSTALWVHCVAEFMLLLYYFFPISQRCRLEVAWWRGKPEKQFPLRPSFKTVNCEILNIDKQASCLYHTVLLCSTRITNSKLPSLPFSFPSPPSLLDPEFPIGRGNSPTFPFPSLPFSPSPLRSRFP